MNEASKPRTTPCSPINYTIHSSVSPHGIDAFLEQLTVARKHDNPCIRLVGCRCSSSYMYS